MALSGRFLGRSPKSLRPLCCQTKPVGARSLSHAARRPLPASVVRSLYPFPKVRTFIPAKPRWATSQEAPSAQAYLASGAITGAKDLVDVKKVLVIGSGGLSIGQAGEFDYSGMLPCVPK
jgi:carbamoyl-phosphate synthase large subunit